MTDDQSTIPYHHLEQTPVHELMQLPCSELDGFIHQAQRTIQNAQTLCDWLTWIKAEKLIREAPDGSAEGGNDDA